jgi:hypothetical protein
LKSNVTGGAEVCDLTVVFSVVKATLKRTTAKDTSLSETVKLFFPILAGALQLAV